MYQNLTLHWNYRISDLSSCELLMLFRAKTDRNILRSLELCGPFGSNKAELARNPELPNPSPTEFCLLKHQHFKELFEGTVMT